MMARCLDEGWGIAADPRAAAGHYQRAADAGHAWAQYNLAHLYLDGRGVARDFRRAFAYYLQAARQNHERAMNLAGRCCEQGWGTPPDLGAAADWYRRSALGGYFRGQFNWASMLLSSGRIEEAAAWFERAASAGSAAVRAAVVQIGARSDAPGALRRLAERLRQRAAG
jgi:TPR repeat protein